MMTLGERDQFESRLLRAMVRAIPADPWLDGPFEGTFRCYSCLVEVTPSVRRKVIDPMLVHRPTCAWTEYKRLAGKVGMT